MRAGVGVVIGRFQVADLTEGHRNVIEAAQCSHDRLVICLGIPPYLSKQNPLDFTTRHMMVKSAYPDAIIVALPDRQSDVEWSRELDALLRRMFPFDNVTLYGGRDSFQNRYSGKFQVKSVGILPLPIESGTDVRRRLGRTPVNYTAFRHGVIYGSQNRFDRSDQAVDIAVLITETVDAKAMIDPLVLVGRKTSDPAGKWRLPGGYVDPAKDESLEAAAKRELYEETNVLLNNGLRYAGSFRVPDWRYRASNDRIYTALFIAQERPWSTAKAGDDLGDVSFIRVSDLNNVLVDEHKQHASLIKRYLLSQQIAQCAKQEETE